MDNILKELEDIKLSLMDDFDNTKQLHFYCDFDDAAKRVLETGKPNVFTNSQNILSSYPHPRLFSN